MTLKRTTLKGFTLTEMLVVLGIILVLMGILIPVVIGAQRQAKKTSCAARLRVIGQALQIYFSEYDETMPMACTGNAMDFPQSRVGFAYNNITTAGLQQSNPWVMPTDASAQYAGPPGFLFAMPPMAYFLGKGAPVSEKMWSCPVLRTGRPGSFRTYQYVEVAVIPKTDKLYTDETEGSMAGLHHTSISGYDEFKPGYQFMGGCEFWYDIQMKTANRRKYHYDQFATRNLAGLRLSEIKPDGGQQADQVVTFADYSVMAHSKETDDMWRDLLWTKIGHYSANFLFLDGHVDYREFSSIAGYFKQLHRPIRQTWGSDKIQKSLSYTDVWDPEAEAKGDDGTAN